MNMTVLKMYMKVSWTVLKISTNNFDTILIKVLKLSYLNQYLLQFGNYELYGIVKIASNFGSFFS